MITLDNFENFVPYKILMRGEEYYDTDAVSELEETSPGEWTATVEGTDDYNVEISMNGKEVESWYCDCPYDGEICKHVVAALLAIRDNNKRVSRSAFSKMRIVTKEEEVVQPDVDIKQLLSFISPQEISTFISEYASTNPEFKAALLKRFIFKESSSTSKGKDYRTEIQKIFNSFGDSKKSRYHNRYNDYSRDWETVFNRMDVFLKKADFFLSLGDMDSTIAIALQTLRSIGENYEDELLYIDDDDDFGTSLYCEHAGGLLMKVVGHPKTTQKQKTDILQELRQIAEISTYRNYGIYDIDELMMQINLSIQPTEKALELIDGLLETRKDTHDLYQLVLRKVNLLLEQNEEQKANETIRQYLYLTEIREMEVEKLIVRCQYDEAIRMLMEYYNKPSLDDHSKAMLTYTLSEGYRLKGDKQGQKHYLALSAIADLKSAVKEYVSLRKLASLVYDEGDIDRAYNYLKCSLEDATLCNARLRTLEISQVFPIIDQAYQLKTKRQQQEMKVSLICISLLSVFLLVAIFFVYKQMKKVAAARREVVDTNTLLQELNEELHDSNSQLKEMNHTLSEANYIKEEYIGRYMDQCSTYLDKMDLYRRSLNKIAAAGRVEELYKAIKSSQFLDEELKEFYANFDMTFLQLFPNFVEEFNALLTEPMQPKPGELLNTELRIFALIRLGITDSTKIAQFLRYSVTTIYNYRTRVRNKAVGEREEFEAKVMQIGKVEE